MLLRILLFVFLSQLGASKERAYRLPDDFLFGAATASYQIEGAWNEDGKGESIWDRMLHDNPEITPDHQNGDVADDSYHKYKEDVQLLKNMNMNTYRFSISWPRILPNGDLSVINKKGIDYYDSLIDELLANGIQPMITMYHWDLPYELQKLGGWANRELALYFKDYAEILFEHFGEKVKWWITFNEPQAFCFAGYSKNHMNHAPGVDKSGIAEYLCGHTVLMAHALTYHLYDQKYRTKQNGLVGITFNSFWAVPKTPSSEDIAATDRLMQFWLGWFAHPIFSPEGDYPPVMKERVAANSAKEGRKRSRLPEFSEEEINDLKESADFLGLNHYTTALVENAEVGETPSRVRDAALLLSAKPDWPTTGSDWLRVVPWGLRENLKWLKEHYQSPVIIITENGVSDKSGTLDDDHRVEYYESYLTEMVKAIQEDGVNVRGYMAWSLLDNFEWTRGYTERFGVYHVDFNSPERTRTPKKSAKFLAKIGEDREIPLSDSQYPHDDL